MAGESLLIVEDDPFMRELLSESLSEAGYQTKTAENGAETRSLLPRIEFDVALIDLSLPDADGMQLVDDISEASSEVQIIILTGYPSIESAIEALRRGAQDYLIKPFKIPEVQAAIARALKNQKLQTEVRGLRRQVRDLEQEVSRLTAGGAQPTNPRPVQLPGAYGGATPPRVPGTQPGGTQSEPG